MINPKRKTFILRFLSTHKYLLFSFFLCTVFFAAYALLSITSHNHYHTFGYDLGINSQVVWRYSHFQLPLTTIDPFPDKTKLATHIELVYALISPFYWIWESRKMLLLLETAFVSFSGLAVYLLAKKKGLHEAVCLSLVVGYLSFYGIQNALWFNTHSASFGAAFLLWFIYFLEKKQTKLSLLFFFLAITSKENIALLTFLIALVLFIKQRTRLLAFFMVISLTYLLFVFFIYFPYIVQMKYLYANKEGLLSNINPLSFIDTEGKREVIINSLLSFGFLPLLSPLYLLPVIGDLATYFVFGSKLPGAQGLFMHYRITLAPLLVWGSIVTIAKYKKLSTWHSAIYLLLCTAITQYTLHLPLSYLTKQWFWTEPSGVKNINSIIQNFLPADASVVSQNNITPHISHRDQIYTLYPEEKSFTGDSPCGQKECAWFRWFGHPKYLIVDISHEWDARHLLINREAFKEGLQNLEKKGVIKKYKQVGNAILYKALQNPDDYAATH